MGPRNLKRTTKMSTNFQRSSDNVASGESVHQNAEARLDAKLVICEKYKKKVATSSVHEIFGCRFSSHKLKDHVV